MLNTTNGEEKRAAAVDEMLGDIHPPVLHRQLTQQKYDDLANRLVSGAMTPNDAIQQLRRYSIPSNDEHARLIKPEKPIPILTKT